LGKPSLQSKNQVDSTKEKTAGKGRKCMTKLMCFHLYKHINNINTHVSNCLSL